MEQSAECVPVSIDDVLITSELSRRTSRPPAYEAENRAIRDFVQEMASTPAGVLQKVAELALRLCHADSAGISILEASGDRGAFRWHAIAGGFVSNGFAILPIDASPCGAVIARNQVLLFDRPGRFYPCLRDTEPPIYETLLAPWCIAGNPVGALWVLSHAPGHKFDAEDARILQGLAQFASAHELALAAEEARNSQFSLEQRVVERTRALSEAFQTLRQESADRAQAEAERAIAEQALRESEKLAAVGRLASSIAHEINNPLEAVTNLLYLAAGSAVDKGTRHYIAQAQIELARVTHIATETLRFHRQSTDASPADLAQIIDSVTSLHEARLRQAGIEIERRFRLHRPLLCFAGEIRQVIANLVSNAVDAMKSMPGARLVLCVREGRHCKTDRPGVRITVADTGTGMDDGTKKRAFEAFFTTKETTGTGLGLWVCREIVHKHGGELQVHSCRSQSHHGSVFSVFLPYPETALQSNIRHFPSGHETHREHPTPSAARP